ncbi:MAG: hypothetical protein AMXMBFR7_22050 [Planctomycetota bacterium]
MTDVLAKLLGIDRLEGGNIDQWSIHWTNLETPFQILLFLLAGGAAAYAVWWFYRREPDYCPSKRKKLLAALRTAGVLLLLVILAGPVLEIVKSGVAKSKVVILADTSKSMTRVDKFGTEPNKLVAARTLGLAKLGEERLPASAEEPLAKATRMDVMRGLFDNTEIGLLKQLQEEYDVELWTFARAGDMVRLGSDGQPLEPGVLEGIEADGMVSEVGGALRATVNRLKGQPLTGIVLVTDGGNNKGEDPVLVAADIPVRVFPIGIGVPEAKDIAVSNLMMESKVFIDDPAPIYVRLKHNGFTGEQCQIVVTMDGEELARVPISLREQGEQAETVRIKPKKAGKFTVRIEVPTMEGDSEPANNVKEKDIEVIDDKIKVLVLESEPRWEYRFFKSALLRDKRLETKILLRVPDLAELARPGSPYIKTFPKKEELFQFDCIIFGNLPNDGFWTEADLELIKRFVVEEGGGIWFIAGKNNLPDSYKESKLEPLFPVEFERNPEVSSEGEQNNPILEGFRLLLTPEGKTHPLMRLDLGGEGGADVPGEKWDLMPEVYWHHKSTRAKLNGIPLLVHGGEADQRAGSRDGPTPLLVTAQNGRGRVLYSAIDEFWRMRFPPELGPGALERFYGHAVQYIGLAHCIGATARIELNTDQEEYAIGDMVKVTARILSKETYDASTADKVPAVSTDLENEANTTNFELTPIPGQPGNFQGALPAKEKGTFRITLRDEDEQGAYKDYAVRIPQIEMDQPDMKKEVLDNVAKASKQGRDDKVARMYFPDEAGELVKELRESQRRLEVRIEDPLWDAPLMALLFTLLMGAEWFLRKRSDLM